MSEPVGGPVRRPGGRPVPGNRWDLVAEVEPGADPSPPSVTVVVTHYRQPAELARTLHALAHQSHPADLLEVVVADDGSPEVPVVAPGGPGVPEDPAVPARTRVVTQTHDGFGAARIRNRAAAVARGEVLVFLDADTTPEPGYVAAMSRLPAVLPEAVTVGRRRHADLAGQPPEEPVARLGPAHELSAPAWLADGYVRTRDLLDSDETSFRLVVGAVVACSRWMFAETGGFEESFDSYGGEDWEWAHRAWTHGAVLAHVPDAVAWHDGPDRADRPGWGDDAQGRDRLLTETLALARRVPAPGLAPAGLAPADAPDPLVTVGPAVSGEPLVLCLDSLLAAFPRARVLVAPDEPVLALGDPRVRARPRGGAGDVPAADEVDGTLEVGSAWRHLHLHRALCGPPAAWADGGERLRGVDAAGHVDLLGTDGAVLATWSSLRAERRAARWGRSDLHPRVRLPAPADLAPPGARVSAQARWGGWA